MLSSGSSPLARKSSTKKSPTFPTSSETSDRIVSYLYIPKHTQRIHRENQLKSCASTLLRTFFFKEKSDFFLYKITCLRYVYGVFKVLFWRENDGQKGQGGRWEVRVSSGKLFKLFQGLFKVLLWCDIRVGLIFVRTVAHGDCIELIHVHNNTHVRVEEFQRDHTEPGISSIRTIVIGHKLHTKVDPTRTHVADNHDDHPSEAREDHDEWDGQKHPAARAILYIYIYIYIYIHTNNGYQYCQGYL